jgi:hypothetical protein
MAAKMVTDEMFFMTIGEKMQCMKILFAKHVVNILPQIIEEKCFGCQVNHPSQKHHDVCLMMDKDEKILTCIDEAMKRIKEEDIFEEFLQLYPDVNNDPYTTHDPSNFYESDEWREEVFKVVYLLF